MPNRCQASCATSTSSGTYCLASLDVDGFDGQRMLVYFSLNQTHDLGVEGGRARRVRIARRPRPRVRGVSTLAPAAGPVPHRGALALAGEALAARGGLVLVACALFVFLAVPLADDTDPRGRG